MCTYVMQFELFKLDQKNKLTFFSNLWTTLIASYIEPNPLSYVDDQFKDKKASII